MENSCLYNWQHISAEISLSGYKAMKQNKTKKIFMSAIDLRKKRVFFTFARQLADEK